LLLGCLALFGLRWRRFLRRFRRAALIASLAAKGSAAPHAGCLCRFVQEVKQAEVKLKNIKIENLVFLFINDTYPFLPSIGWRFGQKDPFPWSWHHKKGLYPRYSFRTAGKSLNVFAATRIRSTIG
jgi:hypothetical protein